LIPFENSDAKEDQLLKSITKAVKEQPIGTELTNAQRQHYFILSQIGLDSKEQQVSSGGKKRTQKKKE
jgi:hypothetical protein